MVPVLSGGTPIGSILENFVEPFMSIRTSSMVGIGYRTRCTASLALRISMQKRTSSEFGFGTTTGGDTHDVGPSTASIMSRDKTHLFFYRLSYSVVPAFVAVQLELHSINMQFQLKIFEFANTIEHLLILCFPLWFVTDIVYVQRQQA